MARIFSPSCALAFFTALAILSVSMTAAQEQPMWQGVEKTADQIEADKVFVSKAIEAANGSADEAARHGVLLGWKEIEKGNPDKALRRFNQAWLINPERGDIYWGFAIALNMRGDNLQVVEKWFEKAESIVGPDWRLHSDWGRVLEERNQPAVAIAHFLKSIETNPDSPEAHVGMVRASLRLGDQKTAEKHLRIYQSLTK